jgi:hypothetical protein
MEQRLDATYLRAGPIERLIAMAVGAVGIGTGILLAAWGIAFLWRYTPPEIAVRISNPEVRVTQETPLKVTQDKPFVITQSEPLKMDPAKLTVMVEGSPRSIDNGVSTDSKTAAGDIIRREVTVFSSVRHGPGTVVTGWNYRDGSGGAPIQQFCYYTAPNVDHSSNRVDIASNHVRLPNLDPGLVPDLEETLTKCQWWLPAT